MTVGPNCISSGVVAAMMLRRKTDASGLMRAKLRLIPDTCIICPHTNFPFQVPLLAGCPGNCRSDGSFAVHFAQTHYNSRGYIERRRFSNYAHPNVGLYSWDHIKFSRFRVHRRTAMGEPLSWESFYHRPPSQHSPWTVSNWEYRPHSTNNRRGYGVLVRKEI